MDAVYVIRLNIYMYLCAATGVGNGYMCLILCKELVLTSHTHAHLYRYILIRSTNELARGVRVL